MVEKTGQAAVVRTAGAMEIISICDRIICLVHLGIQRLQTIKIINIFIEHHELNQRGRHKYFIVQVEYISIGDTGDKITDDAFLGDFLRINHIEFHAFEPCT